MSIEFDQVCGRLRELKSTNKQVFTMPDFSGLGLSGNTIADCMKEFIRRGWVEQLATPHRSSRDDRGIDQIGVKITDKGRREL